MLELGSISNFTQLQKMFLSALQGQSTLSGIQLSCSCCTKGGVVAQLIWSVLEGSVEDGGALTTWEADGLPEWIEGWRFLEEPNRRSPSPALPTSQWEPKDIWLWKRFKVANTTLPRRAIAKQNRTIMTSCPRGGLETESRWNSLRYWHPCRSSTSWKWRRRQLGLTLESLLIPWCPRAWHWWLLEPENWNRTGYPRRTSWWICVGSMLAEVVSTKVQWDKSLGRTCCATWEFGSATT